MFTQGSFFNSNELLSMREGASAQYAHDVNPTSDLSRIFIVIFTDENPIKADITTTSVFIASEYDVFPTKIQRKRFR